MFKRKLVTSKNLAQSTVRLQPSSWQRPGSYTTTRTNARERRIAVTFGPANNSIVLFHGLGFPPSGYQVLSIGSGAIVYNDFPLPATSNVIILRCNTANTFADILVR